MKVLILASGGDGSGMNCCIYHLAKALKKHDVLVCEEGFQGLIENKIKVADIQLLKQYEKRGGVIIKSSRSKEFMTDKGFKKALKNLKNHGIDRLIVLGGNGSHKGFEELVGSGVNAFFIPATIDNDFGGSEYAIGFDTAVANCVDYIDKADDTFFSFNRTGIFEVMGRHCANIARNTFEKSKADILIVDSINISTLSKQVKELKKQKSCPLIIIQENITNVFELQRQLEEKIGSEVRACVIGYIQRGGAPTLKELDYAKRFALLVAKNIDNASGQVVVKDNKFIFERI